MTKILLRRELRKKENEYEVSIYVDDMFTPKVATMTILAESPREAREWVQNRITLKAKKV